MCIQCALGFAVQKWNIRGLLDKLDRLKHTPEEVNKADANTRFLFACYTGDMETVQNLIHPCSGVANQAICVAFWSLLPYGEDLVTIRAKTQIIRWLLCYVDADVMDRIFCRLFMNSSSQWSMILPILQYCLQHHETKTWGIAMIIVGNGSGGNNPYSERFVIHECKAASYLDLEPIRDDAKQIVDVFSRHISLQYLGIDETNIKGTWTNLFIRNPNLTHLVLSGPISDITTAELEHNITLTHLDIKKRTNRVTRKLHLTRNIALTGVTIHGEHENHDMSQRISLKINWKRTRIMCLHQECTRLLTSFPDDMIRHILAPYLFSPQITVKV